MNAGRATGGGVFVIAQVITTAYPEVKVGEEALAYAEIHGGCFVDLILKEGRVDAAVGRKGYGRKPRWTSE